MSDNAKLERASQIGADAWERWVADADASIGRSDRLEALRPYRRQVVRLILEAVTRETGVVWR